MSDSNTGKVLSACTGVGCGVAVLPNTGGNVLLTVFSIVAIGMGALVLTSFAVSRLATKLHR
jgi:hypothetical protein